MALFQSSGKRWQIWSIHGPYMLEEYNDRHLTVYVQQVLEYRDGLGCVIIDGRWRI